MKKDFKLTDSNYYVDTFYAFAFTSGVQHRLLGMKRESKWPTKLQTDACADGWDLADELLRLKGEQ